MNYKYFCAIDLSCNFSSFAISSDKNLIFRYSKELNGRSNTPFFDEFYSSLGELKINLSDINRWIVGCGPGSFTGLRVGTSFIKGIIFDKDVESFGISSALPIAMKTQPLPNEKIAVLFFSAGKSIMVSSFVYENGSFVELYKPFVAEVNSHLTFDVYDHVVFVNNINLIKLLGNVALSEKKLLVLDDFPIELFFTENWNKSKMDISDLIYIRPPSIGG